MVMSLSYEESVAVITWDDGENRVNLDSLGRLHEILDELESTDGPLAIVWTGTGKFFSNGLDLARFGSNPDELFATLTALHRTVARLLLFPAYSVGALNGHTFAAGALLSCGLDYFVGSPSVCRSDCSLRHRNLSKTLSACSRSVCRRCRVSVGYRWHCFGSDKRKVRCFLSSSWERSGRS